MNAQEAPDRWKTNPVDNDTDSDKLPDGWEVYYSQLALELGLVDNSTFDSTGQGSNGSCYGGFRPRWNK